MIQSIDFSAQFCKVGFWTKSFFFAGLRDKLAEKYLQNGRIIPPAPDKSIIGMTKIKMSKEEDNTDQSGTVSWEERRDQQ